MKNWRYWGDPGYWRWLWQRVGRDMKALAAVVAAVAFAGLGFVVADGVAGDESAQTGDVVKQTTIVRTLTTRSGGKAVVRTVRIAPGRTFLTTTTEQLVRTVTEPGGTRVVTEAVTMRVPVVRRVVVSGQGRTQTQVETVARTVTNEHTTTAVATQTQTETVTQTDTDTVTVTDGRRTRTVTTTVESPPVTQTVTQTTTVTQPAVTITISVPILP